MDITTANSKVKAHRTAGYKPLAVRRRAFTPTSPANPLLSYPPSEGFIKPPIFPAPASPSPRHKRLLVAAGTQQHSGNPFTNAGK